MNRIGDRQLDRWTVRGHQGVSESMSLLWLSDDVYPRECKARQRVGAMDRRLRGAPQSSVCLLLVLGRIVQRRPDVDPFAENRLLLMLGGFELSLDVLCIRSEKGETRFDLCFRFQQLS